MVMGPGAWNSVMKILALTAHSKLVRYSHIAYDNIAEGQIRMAHVLRDKTPGEGSSFNTTTHYAVVMREEVGETEKMIEDVRAVLLISLFQHL
jgi:hypothetical protein